MLCRTFLIMIFVASSLAFRHFPIVPPPRGASRLLATLTLEDGVYEAEIVRKKSRFIGVASHVADFSEAERFISRVRGDHPKSRHVVFGYVGCNTERSTDDGEPTGTAGSPVLSAVKGEGLSEVCCVVVRYSGGIKLGAGGLIRAYGGAAREVLRSASTMEVEEKSSFMITIPPSNVGDLYGAVAAFAGVMDAIGDSKYHVTVPASSSSSFIDALTSKTAGAAAIIKD